MLNRLQTQTLDKDEQGFAAIIVTMVLVVVVGLIVLGFAVNARQEQERTLNNQLSTEAYYAAESGVNNAYTIISNYYEKNQTVPDQTKYCSKDNNNNNTYNNSTAINGSLVGVTCLLVNTSPPSLEYSPIDAAQGQVIPIFGENSTGSPVATGAITISWQEHDMATSPSFISGSTCPSNSRTTSFPPLATWSSSYPRCSAPVLQVDVAPATGWTDATSLIADTTSVFLLPGSGSGVVNLSSGVNGDTETASCVAANPPAEYDCYETLNFSNGAVPDIAGNTGGNYYLHVVPMYFDADISVTASGSNSLGVASGLDMSNAQALIDSTAQASGEYKRIQERVSINPVGSNNEPIGGLQAAGSICKDFTTRPGVSNPSSNC